MILNRIPNYGHVLEFHKKEDEEFINNYLELKITMNNLENIIHSKEFINEMSRFIPLDVQQRTLQKDKFLNLLNNEISSLLENVEIIVRNKN